MDVPLGFHKKKSILCFLCFVFHFPSLYAISFNYSNFLDKSKINKSSDAFITSDGILSLTRNQVDLKRESSVGRAVYAEEMHLWDAGTGQIADFSTHFSFNISQLPSGSSGDGLAFFLSPNGSQVPERAGGGNLGLITNSSNLNQSENPIVAVEFDTYKNDWDPSDNHVGININSIQSVTNLTWDTSMKNGSRANAWISYNSQTSNLSLFLTYLDNPVFLGNSSLSYEVNLSKVLPEWVSVGLSSATGTSVEVHYILSWEFNSTELISDQTSNNGNEAQGGANIGVVIGYVVGGMVLVGGIILTLVFGWRKRSRKAEDQDSTVELDDHSIDNEFEHGMGPKKFYYGEVARSTNNFSEEGKLGEGGFGGVYKGFLYDLNLDVAVKRVSRSSKQGKKEYIAEVKIIGRLRHKNLVQLIGWCHEKGELLLIYDFMPNGSLDFHLFGGENVLSWNVRYNIALGLASALLYLHEEWEQGVVHRDIKSSNVMLDSNFNAKLGDFGLARLMDNELGLKTTGLAGTFGYMAPEYISIGKASKGSDVYSFGVVALEIACGRRSVEPRNVESQISLVTWVWEAYGNGRLVDVADEKLSKDFDLSELECLMMVGLWCAHPDHNLRPFMRQALQVLNFELALPNLPQQMPVPRFDLPTSSTSSTGPY
ncbi:hypothetical protein LWI28_001651 [Acer negundo]|uniref:non-specific serine/threonine protein kinase n=1 Tax=Acer negundo TaxID=4023 RepID=A0AAD5JL00_ACENE|nr:hypothetical protein LWI28_001651 [Acer negundo]